MSVIMKYMSMVKFNHTIFALPFALTGYVYGLIDAEQIYGPFDWLLLVKILFCMVFARNTAMGFNRWADRRIDAENPRTARREIPAGHISPHSALVFTIVNAAGFLVVAGLINKLTLVLAPLALFVVMGYSYTKRFTAWSHIVLGLSLAIAPVGAYIAVTGSLAVVPILLAGVVLTWVSGFDILYAFQDAEHDRTHNLHSIPARFSAKTAVGISIFLHVLTVYALIVTGMYYGAGVLYWTGTCLFVALLIIEHLLFTPRKVDRIAAIFGLVNGCSSVVFAVFAILDRLMLAGIV